MHAQFSNYALLKYWQELEKQRILFSPLMLEEKEEGEKKKYYF